MHKDRNLLLGSGLVLLSLVVFIFGSNYLLRQNRSDTKDTTPFPDSSLIPAETHLVKTQVSPLLTRISSPTSFTATPQINTPTPTLSPSPAPSPTATPLILSFCDQSPAAKPIPDYETITDTLDINFPGNILDINVSLDIEHTFVGDLKISLKHPESGEVILLDRSGNVQNRCSGQNIQAVFDDEAPVSVNTICNPAPPAISGLIQPNQTLLMFDQLAASATWTLSVSDFSTPDTGVLNQWCLIITLTTP
jgi:subtilisin-like proprotein convertase family protein